MLQMCMDQNFFLYGMIAAGILGVWCLFWSSRFYHTAVKDMRRREEPKGRWTEEILELADRRGAGMRDTEAFIRNRLQEGRILGQRVESLLNGVSLASSLCGIFLLLGIWGIYLLQYERYVLYQYTLTAGSIISLLLLARYSLNFSEKKQRLLEGWRDYLDNQRTPSASVEAETVREPAAAAEHTKISPMKRSEQEAAITQVEEKIREKASPKSKFAELMNPEDEKLMREVIREYLT